MGTVTSPPSSSRGSGAFGERRYVPVGVNCIAVNDTLDAMQRLVAWHRSHFHGPVVGITGSNGKTV